MDFPFKNIELIVINQNGKHLLEECFQSILETTPADVRVTLMDNGSSDGSISYVQENFPKVHILDFGRNLGFAGGYDQAIRESESEYIVMLNNDIKALPGWFEPLVEPLRQKEVGITGSRLYRYDDANFLDHGGGKISISGGGIDIGKKTTDETPLAQNYSTSYACGAAMAFRKTTYVNLNGFDPGYVIYHEDVDLGWKALLSGLQVLHIPRSRILHKVSASMGHFENPRRLYLSQKNRLFNLFKNAGWWLLMKGLAANFIFDVFRTAGWCLRGKFKNVWILFLANTSAYASFPRLLGVRFHVQRNIRKKSDSILAKDGAFAGFKESFRSYMQLKK